MPTRVKSFEHRVADHWPQALEKHFREFVLPTMQQNPPERDAKPRSVLLGGLQHVWQYEVSVAGDSIARWEREGSDQTAAGSMLIDAAMKAAACANFVSVAHLELDRDSQIVRLANTDVEVAKFVRRNADLLLRSAFKVLLLDLSIIQFRRWMDRLRADTLSSLIVENIEPGLIRAWKTGGGVPVVAAHRYAQMWREHCWESWVLTLAGAGRGLSDWLQLGSMDRLPSVPVPKSHPFADKLLEWVPQMLVSSPERFERSSEYRLSGGEYGELMAACMKQQAEWGQRSNGNGNKGAGGGPESGSDQSLPRKPGGWTKQELCAEADIKGSSFDRIREAARVKASKRGGEGQQRRFSNKELKKLIEYAPKACTRLGKRAAEKWRLLLPS